MDDTPKIYIAVIMRKQVACETQREFIRCI